MKNLKKKNGKVLDFKVPIGVVLCTFFFFGWFSGVVVLVIVSTSWVSHH